MDPIVFLSIAAVFVAATLLLGWYGYRHTRDGGQFLINKEKSGPVIIALSYGATFLSASAVVGFGGQAAKYGLSMIWLVFLNLFVGLVVAFLVFGKRTRRLSKDLGAFTFSDFLGKRLKSPMIRTLSAMIILVGMPVYCAAVMLGGTNFLGAAVGIDKNVALLIFAAIVAVYVTYGGIVAVMYNDALQAAVMLAGMIVLGVFTFYVLDGFTGTNLALADLWASITTNPGDPNHAAATKLMDGGMNGWTAFSTFGSEVWLTMVTTFLLGVGIGALSQPQLVVRFMSAKDDRVLNRSLAIGALFMLSIVGVAYTVGAMTNLYFYREFGEISVVHCDNVDMIIPTFVNSLFDGVFMGDVFVAVFVLAILSASLSTLAALLHTMGASGGYDLWSQVSGEKTVTGSMKSLRANRITTMVMMVVVVVLAFAMPGDIIAKATSIFMGLTAATLLPSYAYSLFSKDPGLKGPAASIIVGSVVWAAWAFFVNIGIAPMIGLCELVFGTPTLALGKLVFVDPLVVSLPLSVAALLVGAAVDARGGGEEAALAPA
ncbi:MAG: sodium:solute symporter family protein [Thermoplasmatales archaeon]|nr:sodium:solute symporter family protein [Thermoplasmatales archaeon]